MTNTMPSWKYVACDVKSYDIIPACLITGWKFAHGWLLKHLSSDTFYKSSRYSSKNVIYFFSITKIIVRLCRPGYDMSRMTNTMLSWKYVACDTNNCDVTPACLITGWKFTHQWLLKHLSSENFYKYSRYGSENVIYFFSTINIIFRLCPPGYNMSRMTDITPSWKYVAWDVKSYDVIPACLITGWKFAHGWLL